MKNKIVTLLVAFVVVTAFSACGGGKKSKIVENEKKALMWFDATANFERFSHKDSIDFYLTKIKDLGFTHAIVDMRPISGDVLYASEIAPRLTEWKGAKHGDFDFLGYFIEKGHELGLEIHASLNTFVAGHNYFDMGPIYETNPEWATMVYTPSGEIVPITELKQKYSAMANPNNKEFQQYILSIFEELVTKYPKMDGIMLDRVRYDGLMADFSKSSRVDFENYIGKKLKQFPQDVFEWVDKDGKPSIKRGEYFLKWVEWRTSVITSFMKEARETVKRVNPNLQFGTYTGAWYPSYYEVGVNFASTNYDPAKDFDWATPSYKELGYAEVIDLYTVGNYYHDVSISDYEKTKKVVVNETDIDGNTGLWYCVEGSCKKLRNVLKENKFIGGILADQFYDKPEDLARSITMNVKESDGVMIFDIVHIIEKNMWSYVEKGMKEANMIKK